jgi:hypothetical protein
MELPVSVTNIIKQDFAEADQKEIETVLSSYGDEPYQREQERVLLYILQLAKGDKKQVQELIKTAKNDYRDIIFFAENPDEAKLDTPEKKAEFDKMLKQFGIKKENLWD